MQIAIATCTRLPEPDPDAPLLERALREAGHEPVLLAWDDASKSADFAKFPCTVIRSTWNYYEDVEGFVRWAERTASVTKLLNPATIVRWNTDKRYLADLEKNGVGIVPTVFVDRGESRDVGDVMREQEWASVVIKPVVSGGSYRTARFGQGEREEAQRFLSELTRDRGAMIQQYMPSVDGYGERSLVWIDGGLSHAIRKSPRLSGAHESVSPEVPIADDEREFADRILAPYAKDLLYARVDIVRDDAAPESPLRVMELELVEPSLFFVQCPRALVPFVRAIERHAK